MVGAGWIAFVNKLAHTHNLHSCRRSATRLNRARRQAIALIREVKGTESAAVVERRDFVEAMKAGVGIGAKGRGISGMDDESSLVAPGVLVAMNLVPKRYF